LRAVATCYRWTSGEFARTRKAADEGSAECKMVGVLGMRLSAA
jgi:hypothetical protein